MAKRRGGPKGQDVTGSDIGDKLHGGKHFFGKGTEPEVTGHGEVFGQRPGPDGRVYWYFHQLPADDDKRKKIDELMQKRVEKIEDAKTKSFENLKQYYLRRAAFIEQYKSMLK